MQDLYTRFNREFKEKVTDFRKLLGYLADSYFGCEADLVRIRQSYRELVDLQAFFINKNDAITSGSERSSDKDLREKDAMRKYIERQTVPFVKLYQFIIELYEENK